MCMREAVLSLSLVIFLPEMFRLACDDGHT